MTFVFKKIRYGKRKRSVDGQIALDRLESYLNENTEKPVEMLATLWQDQSDAISYQDLRAAVRDGYMSEDTVRQWSNDYAHLVTTQLDTLWTNAIFAGTNGQPIIDAVKQYFVFNMYSSNVSEWIKNRGAELVTNSTETQREAIRYILGDGLRQRYDVDQLARLIRPCIGLTKSQVSSARKLYDNTLAELRSAHPKARDSVLQKKAVTKTMQYAERAHRQRALTIAQTEIAKAYNFGADETIRQAQENQLIGKVIKRWNTAGDLNVCSHCADLNGTEVGMEEYFYDGSKIVEDGLYPPLHPRCACAIQYIEVEKPRFNILEAEESKPKTPEPEVQEAVADLERINSNEYSKRYTKLDEDMKTVRSVRDTAKEFVEHRNGTLKEDLAFIDSNTGKVLKNMSGVTDRACSPTEKMMAMLNGSEDYSIIGLHTHPTSMPPSENDIFAAIQRKYKYGLIAGHDGTIYKYTITDRNITTDDISRPKLIAALKNVEREKVDALLSGNALTKVSEKTYNELISNFVKLEIL